MTDSWITEPFISGDRAGTITFVPGNPTKGFKAAIRVEMLGPHESLYLRGPALQALLDFLEKHQPIVQDVLSGKV